ncbi:MAG TPA: UDP-N-acetylmuramoyl-L-alanine--D-glutamate ligase [Candidatus Stercoripulliclostridium merdigallinarum]|uniref:UDP-N-acetylmuramoylalanine--D-glutamate ligase n=1 Tax=Candidatus Stercoripulliclostridium merdigallinarum TaxID=2840951 RepID=A0A9D1MHH4_9FIRM|nr:UDP-N-acetylmuramoyl-L-alanine--D-glutamate ligase [Candidatus Stercoripulliclostridium merdigallinarum]
MEKAIVIGMRLSGTAAKALLSKQGYEVVGVDDNPEVAPATPDCPIEEFALGVVSPAIANDHPLIVAAQKAGVKLISELELGIRNLKGIKVVVTGTNGKTTVCDMIDKALKLSGITCRTMGNIGYPVSQVALDGTEYAVNIIEASSFQLEHTYTLRPDYAVLTNIAPDHMDRYPDFAGYFSAKKRVFRLQTASDVAVLNYDQPAIRELGKHLASEVVWVSAAEAVGDCYIKNNAFYLRGEQLISVKESKLRGEFNRFNMMTAITVAARLGATKEALKKFVREYRPLPHRIEYVGVFRGKRCFNDSKGTNVSATLAALDAMEGSTALIMGGSDKKEDYCEFFLDVPEKLKFVAVTGANAEKIYGSALKVGFNDIVIVKDLQAAIIRAAESAADIVLFSPASASFDRYTGYKERGERFKNLVSALK